ncbi:hypothetical protein [Chamaesiphon sp. GL140_3_metabinner_50]|uniref:hypothetical protein n=1 Tax=Chamaesiphon sp. GL140_3_metabinner_50 TaxID=2970812 RepID=UPI0025F9BC70|nr:hypothetical protein [Chamaesiphon sp. GL140_3_metabinner_50]
MSIVVTLSPELEEQLREKAVRQGQDINLVATELLASILEWETQDSAAAIAGIQQGLDEFVSSVRILHIRHSSQQAIGEEPKEPNAI